MAECSECGDEFTVDDGCDDDGMCHPCAHDLAAGVVATRAARDKADEVIRELRAQVVTGTPYLVALFPVTCRCGADLHDLAACAAHECVRPLADESTETKGKP